MWRANSDPSKVSGFLQVLGFFYCVRPQNIWEHDSLQVLCAFCVIGIKWAMPWESLPYVICEQHRPISACACTQSDQCLCYCYSLPRYYNGWVHNLKHYLVSEGEQAGLSLYLVADHQRQVFSWWSSNKYCLKFLSYSSVTLIMNCPVSASQLSVGSRRGERPGSGTGKKALDWLRVEKKWHLL